MLTEKEQHLYSRQLLLPNFGEETQAKLKAASVLVVGAGGLGSPLLLYLAAAGIGQLGIVDADVVELSNLQRQLLYKHSDIGEQKAKLAVAELEQHNPYIQLHCYPEKLTIKNAETLIAQYDIIVGALDNAATRYLIDDTCKAFGKIYVHGSISQYEGQVSVFNPNTNFSYRDLFSEPPSTDFASPVDKAVFAPLPGLIGTLMASEVIKLITNQGQTLSGKLLMVNLLTNSFQTVDFS